MLLIHESGFSVMIEEMLERYAKEMGFVLSDDNIKSLVSFAIELKKWNSRVNLTAITKDNEVAIKHFLDSLQLAPYVFDNDHVLDVGSGAGLPVIPLKIVKPATMMLSVDAVAKKVNFQRHIIRVLRLQGIEALHARVEDLQKTYAHKFSFITSRAFTRLDHFVALVAPLLARGGRLVAMKGEDAEGEIAASRDALKELGFIVTATHSYELPCNMGKHCLVEMMACKLAQDKGLEA